MSPPQKTTPYDGRDVSLADIMVELKGQTKILTKLDKTVNGERADQKDGLVVRVDRLEQQGRFVRRLVTGGGLTGLLAAGWSWLTHGSPPTTHP